MATQMILKKKVINFHQKEVSQNNKPSWNKVLNRSKKASKKAFEKVNLIPIDLQTQSESLLRKMNQRRSLKKFQCHLL